MQPHPSPLDDGCGGTLVTRAFIVYWTGEHESSVRRGLTPVACHVPTRAYLYRLAEVDAWLKARSEAA